MTDIPTLRTARLTLRAYREDDFDAYAAMWADPAVVRFITPPLSREAAWARFLRQIGMWRHLGFGFFALEETETGCFAGEAGFHDLRRAIAPSLQGALEAGWCLTSARQGRGLAEEAMRAAIGWADVEVPRKPMTCIISPDHVASLHVADKLGFREFARARYNERPIVLLERAREGAPGAAKVVGARR